MTLLMRLPQTSKHSVSPGASKGLAQSEKKSRRGRLGLLVAQTSGEGVDDEHTESDNQD